MNCFRRWEISFSASHVFRFIFEIGSTEEMNETERTVANRLLERDGIQFQWRKKKKQLNRKKANRETILNIEYNFAMCVRFAQLFGYFNLSYKNRHMGLQLLLTTNVDSATWTFLLGWAIFTAKSIYHFSLDLWCSERDKARERAHPLSKCDVETEKA